MFSALDAQRPRSTGSASGNAPWSPVPDVAAYKWQNNALIRNAERERAVTAHAIDVARTMGFAPDGVQAVFDLQVRAARESQERLHETRRTRGFEFTGPIPNLEQDVRSRLDRLVYSSNTRANSWSS